MSWEHRHLFFLKAADLLGWTFPKQDERVYYDGSNKNVYQQKLMQPQN